MKKNYIQPDMQVVKLQPRYRLLVGSSNTPNGYDGKTVSTYRGVDEQISSEDDIF